MKELVGVIAKALVEHPEEVVVTEEEKDGETVVTLKVAEPGAYMTQVRHRVASPAGAPTPYRSYTHTLTFIAHAD